MTTRTTTQTTMGVPWHADTCECAACERIAARGGPAPGEFLAPPPPPRRESETMTTQTTRTTTQTTAIDAVNDEIDEMILRREYDGDDHVHAQAIEIDPDEVWVELAERATTMCSRCGQTLPPACAVTWMARQGGSGPGGWWADSGSYSQQHGCGSWEAPEHVSDTITVRRAEDGRIDTDLLRADLARLARRLLALVVEAERDAAAECAAEVARVHADVIDALGRGDASDVAEGDGDNGPGTVWDGQTLTTWDWSPVDGVDCESVSTPVTDLPPAARATLAALYGHYGH